MTRREPKKPKSKRPVLDGLPPQATGPYAPAGAGIRSGKRPAVLEEPRLDDRELVVRFNRIDLGGPWCLTKISTEDHTTLLTRLRDIEKQTAHEVFNSGANTGAHYEVEEIPNPVAGQRLEEMGFGDETRVSRLRVTKKYRLHGLLKRNHFYAIWWDPDHTVWPTER